MSDKRFPANIISSTPVEPTGSFQDDTASGSWSLQEAFTYVKAGLWPTAGNQKPLIEDVFSTYLYTGNGSTQTITNGIDLAGEGGLVWLKARNDANEEHNVYDTERGATKRLITHATFAEATETQALTSFNSNGFSVGSANMANRSGFTYASWTFRQAPRFFDVVTYTGTGANRTITHDLGVVPGCIIVKRTDTTGDWQVYHRSNANTEYMVLNTTAAKATGATRWNSTTPTSSVFSLGTDATVNASGGTYVAYLFAHDPLGLSGDGSDGLIACGSFATGGLVTVNLGWEPQFVLWKLADTTSDWQMFDNMRGMTVGDDAQLEPNTSDAELTGVDRLNPTATGFTTSTFGSGFNVIYIAIRRGPMREPTVGTEVFAMDTLGGTAPTPPTYNSGFPVDFAMQKGTHGTSGFASTRLLSGTHLVIESTAAESAFASSVFDYMNGWRSYVGVDSRWYSWMFRRAPGFFDVVAYTGDGTLNPIGHNLTVNPELIIFKRRSSVQDWWVIHYATDKSLRLNTTAAGTTADASIYGPVTPTTFVPYLNTAGQTHISYHFASLPGISKVGSYTGNGSNQTINCGFTTGARFILIKRTDSTGDWYVWDTARGIVSGNDPHLSLNTTAAEVTTDDSVDAESSGFIVNQDAATNVNVNAASYIFLAIA